MAVVDVRIARREEKQRVEDFFRALSEKTVVTGARISVQGKIDRPPWKSLLKARRFWIYKRNKDAIFAVCPSYFDNTTPIIIHFSKN